MNFFNKFKFKFLQIRLENSFNLKREQIRNILSEVELKIDDPDYMELINELDYKKRDKFYDDINRLKLRLEQIELELGQYQNDEIFSSLSWKPNKKGGYGFKTKEVIICDNGTIVFKTKPLIPIIYSIVTFIVFCFFYDFLADISNNEFYIIPLYLIVTCSLFYYYSRDFILDNELKYFYKGKLGKIKKNQINGKRFISFDKIHAIQILEERVRKKNGYFYSYEINLVLKDGKRITLVDHSKLDEIKTDSEKVAKLLDIPIWSYELR